MMLQSRLVSVLASVFLIALSSASALAQSPQSAQVGASPEQPRRTQTSEGKQRTVRQTRSPVWMTEHNTTPIISVIDVVATNSGKRFLLDYRVPNGIVVGPAGYADMDYEAFLRVLDNNDLAAVTTGDYVTVLPEGAIRQAEMPVLKPGETAAAGDWVTRVFVLKHIRAPQLVPILRPLMPRSAHLAAQADANALLVVDRYVNTERLREVIEAMDVPEAGD
ncbi:MAG: secretin N-terminal domain-containing protein [Pseudomonadota bacterium]